MSDTFLGDIRGKYLQFFYLVDEHSWRLSRTGKLSAITDHIVENNFVVVGGNQEPCFMSRLGNGGIPYYSILQALLIIGHMLENGQAHPAACLDLSC